MLFWKVLHFVAGLNKRYHVILAWSHLHANVFHGDFVARWVTSAFGFCELIGLQKWHARTSGFETHTHRKPCGKCVCECYCAGLGVPALSVCFSLYAERFTSTVFVCDLDKKIKNMNRTENTLIE